MGIRVLDSKCNLAQKHIPAMGDIWFNIDQVIIFQEESVA